MDENDDEDVVDVQIVWLRFLRWYENIASRCVGVKRELKHFAYIFVWYIFKQTDIQSCFK